MSSIKPMHDALIEASQITAYTNSVRVIRGVILAAQEKGRELSDTELLRLHDKGVGMAQCLYTLCHGRKLKGYARNAPNSGMCGHD